MSSTSPAMPSARVTVACAAVLATAVALSWSGSLPAPFVLDDHESILTNGSIRGLASFQWLAPPATGGETVSGRPILNLSFAVNHAFGDLEVRGYRAANVLIHFLAALTLFGIVRRTCRRAARSGGSEAAEPVFATGFALAVALLWAVHPLQTAAVTYIAQRAESLAGLFYLLTLYCFIRAADSERGGTRWAAASVVSCLLGVATKETVVTAPLAVLLYDRVFCAGTLRAAWRARWRMHAALAATWLLLLGLLIGSGARGGSAGFDSAVGPLTYLLTQAGAILRYLALAIWPHSPVFDYGVATAAGISSVVPQFLFVSALGVLAAWALWRNLVPGFLGACFFLLLAPSSSVVPVATQTIAEHRMYLPLAPLAVLTCLVGEALVRHSAVRWSSAMLAGGVAVALVVATQARNRVYLSEAALWRDTVAKRPDNPRAHNNLGIALYHADRIDEAADEFRRTIALQPNHAFARANLGKILVRQRRSEGAVAQLEAALAADNQFAEARIALAHALASLGRLDDAVAHYRTSLRDAPESADAHFGLGNVLAKQRQLEPAIHEFQAALRSDPTHIEARNNLANCLLALGRFDEAIAHYEQSLRARPADEAVRKNLEIARELRRTYLLATR